MLPQEWFGKKKMLSICSGGLHVGILKPVFDLLGTNIGVQIGGGIHSHPDGTHAGAMAVRQAIDAYMKDIAIEEYAEKNKELKRALDKWGTKVYE
ncbi:Ribulose bisphosphate carboxylase [Candidatus Tiddalikarchaeum anstoanum]|nr:Ribulose bisphosphate carboxylase [Candidatus Tiddalikarchaeum anstoanum]